MSRDRKLTAEIARTLKKIDEGVQVFDALYDKVYSSETQSQKLKYEGDLKKEIKKLQRQRDSLKNWIGNTDIKDKSKLITARKLIESKMEAFKICEKETKTKAYSKEGLARSSDLSPEDRERLKTRNWLTEKLSAIRQIIDEKEAELEVASAASSSRKRKKKKKAFQVSEAEEELTELIEQHQYHAGKIEIIVRMLDNNSLEPKQVEEIKDDIEYYVNYCNEPDFYNDPDIYEILDIDGPNSNMKFSMSSSSGNSGSETSSIKSPSKKASVKKAVIPTLTIGRGVSKKEAAAALSKIKENEKAASDTKKSEEASLAAAKSGGESMRAQGNAVLRQKQVQQQAQQAKLQAQQAMLAQQQHLQDNQQVKLRAQQQQQQQAQQQQRQGANSNGIQDTNGMGDAGGGISGGVGGIGSGEGMSSVLGAGKGVGGQGNKTNGDGQPLMTHALTHHLLDAAMWKLPMPSDSHRSAHLRYQSRNPFNTPALFPQEPATIIQRQELYPKLDVDTLFFIFYFQQGSYQQYLAAAQLKKLSWRYHKKYKTWFQRHEEPTETTDEYERGTYVYFDFESGWCQRIKTEFTFEYAFLEDDLKAISASAP